MSRLQALCPRCATPVSSIVLRECWNPSIETLPFANDGSDKQGRFETFNCGHLFYKERRQLTQELLRTQVYQSLDGRKSTRTYQVGGLRFIEESNFNCLVADQQGLGKTIEALLALREHKNVVLPALVIVKSATLWQWQREIKEWCDSLPNGVWMIRNGKDWIPPGFSIYLLSMDTLRAFVKPAHSTIRIKTARFGTTSKEEFVIDPKLASLNLKCVVADEVHSFKNTSSKRSQSLVELISLLNIEHKIFLSGTPIMNRASEYFIPLNLLDPATFPSFEHFQRNYLTDDGKRILPYMMERFKERTERLIIRRERNQVLKDLPSFQRIFEDVTIENEALKKHYNAELEKMREKDSTKDKELTYNDIKDNLMTMRRIIGKAKAELIVDFVNEFMEQTESEKLCIGIHHIEVRDYLLAMLASHRPLSLSGEDSSDRKQQIVDAFAKPERRLLIANIVAGGTGLNLQFCNNCIVLERQWNAAVEEQFEDRFNRFGQKLPVTSMYPKVLKTVDQWFAEMVEEKRAIFGETVALDLEQWLSQGVGDMLNWMFAQGRL
ncbi:MAG: DEAD/DEAH box helicase [Patescibacteria group bacterium]|nr:DEAD/DEAH box helicase [Patescibacteria group bacterium]